jgi:hypothetical protein
MPVLQLRRTANVGQMPTAQIYQQLEAVLPTGRTNGPWSRTPLSQQRQQYLFSRAMELYHRPNVTNAQNNRALTILRTLAMNYNRVWTNNPRRTQLFAGSNNNESNYNVNVMNYMNYNTANSNAEREANNAYRRARARARAQVSPPRARAQVSPPRANNTTGIHSLFIKTNHVKLPSNRPIDAISHHKFKKGDVATRIRQNGTNAYFRTGAFNSWFGHNWKHMSPNSNAKISNKKHPLTRATVTRRNVSRVKFV